MTTVEVVETMEASETNAMQIVEVEEMVEVVGEKWLQWHKSIKKNATTIAMEAYCNRYNKRNSSAAQPKQ